MPCLLALLAVAFPRVAIVLLWLFSNFFTGVYHSIIIPVIGFLLLPLTMTVYTYLAKTSGGHLTTTQFVFIFIAVVVDLGLVGGGTLRRKS
jgi:hypothetical protein